MPKRAYNIDTRKGNGTLQTARKGVKTMTFIEVLNHPKARKLVDLIEELLGETEAELVRIRTHYIAELKANYGYEYEI